MAQHNEVGKLGEKIALKYLEQKGYKIMETNWRYSRAEIDIIAKDGEVLTFIEVKTRSTDKWGSPSLAVTPKKERFMADASGVYMEQIGHTWEIRFDIVAVVIINDLYHEVTHHKDAFFPGIDI